MSIDKRNQFLDAGDSDDGVDRNQDSDDDLQKGERSAKRRRVADEESNDEDFSDEDQDQDDGGTVPDGKDKSITKADTEEERRHKGVHGLKTLEEKKNELPGLTQHPTKKNLVVTEEAIKKSGVVYNHACRHI